MIANLNRIVCWGHELLAEKISKGQLTVDLTLGNGYDALMLWQQVGETGQVVGFDVQAEAIENSRQRLLENSAPVRTWQAGDYPLAQVAGVDLVAAGHQQLQHFLPVAPHGIVANLGYLPGGDKSIITRPETTLQALQQACEVLAPEGRLAVVVYAGHPGGREESQAVDSFFSELDENLFQVVQLKVPNRPEAPYLLVAEKRA